ncbi:MAG: kinase/pyrophosphorylase [Alphaproteobacteria bacterium]|nr:kinase/pyrophosphorylase [Alphaproteobacteria bacterium]MCY4231537.1 kinase/pyrophosphorylase [Alphaproteobacteria bacterium]MCY4317926.1 kinase/pyrophosphorylase [Alphaproteobacteria bacterium]
MDSPVVHLHLVSDATGETVRTLGRACISQFDGIAVREHFWVLIRNTDQLLGVIEGIRAAPGVVLATVVNDQLRHLLEVSCREAGAPFVSLLDEPVTAISEWAGRRAHHRPGRRQKLDDRYFARIDAMQFTMVHDDGQMSDDLDEADVVLIGVSRSSKTPTCIYLANLGYKAANVPFVPEVPLPEEVIRLTRPLVMGLTVDPDRLVQIRRNRLRSLYEQRQTNYVDLERVRTEVAAARRLFTERGWPFIDVTRRSIEETAAGIIRLLEGRSRDSAAG